VARLQLLGVKTPEPLLARPTLPVGTMAVPVPESLTVTLQVSGELTAVCAAHDSTTLAGRGLTVRIADELLGKWLASGV
jgi:hypothetical protein